MSQKSAHIIRIIILLLSLFAYTLSVAQKLNLSTFGQSHGLPGNEIYDIHQSQSGNLWVATSGGLCKYNGQSFSTVELSDTASSAMLSVCSNPQGQILFVDAASKVGVVNEGLDEQVHYLNGGKRLGGSASLGKVICTSTYEIWVLAAGLFRSLDSGKTFSRIDTNTAYFPSHVVSMTQGKDGSLWFGCKNRVVNYKDGQFFHSVTLLPETPYNLFATVMHTTQNSLYLGTNGSGIIEIRDISVSQLSDSAALDIHIYQPGPNLLSNVIMTCLERNDGQIWFGGYRAIYSYTPTLQDSGFVSYGNVNGFPTNQILTLFQDSESNLWFGTYQGGLVQLPAYSNDVSIVLAEQRLQHAAENNIRAIAAEHGNQMWLGTRNGLYRIPNPTGTKLANIQKQPLQISAGKDSITSTVSALFVDNSKSLWIGTYGGMPMKRSEEGNIELITKSKHKLANYVVRSITQTRQGQIIIGTNKGISILDNETQTFSNFGIGEESNGSNVLEASDGTIWIATDENSLCYFENDSIKEFPMPSSLKLQGTVFVCEDPNGSIWFGKLGLGLFKIQEDSTLLRLSKADGLSSDQISWAIFDPQGRLWVGTSKGVDRIELDYLKITHFPSIIYGDLELNQNSVAIGPDNRLWFGTSGGAVSMPLDIGPRNLPLPLVSIDYVEQDNGLPVNTAGPLSHNENNLRFGLKTITFTAPERVRLQWRLTGLNQQWSEPTTARVATFPNLEPGSYEFLVRATKDGEHWTEPVSYTFTIEPPFWQRTWFIVSATLAGLLLIFLLNRLVVVQRTRNLERAKQMLERDLQERNKELEHTNEELAKLSIVAENTNNAVAICNGKGEIEWVNQAFLKMTGYTLDELTGTHGERFRLLNDVEEVTGNNIYAPVIRQRRSLSFVLKNRAKNGQEFWTYTSMTPTFDDQDNIRKIIALDTDITERIESERALEEAKTRAEESEKIKEQFLANMSHEIRTPMNAIVGMVELLSKSEQEPKQARYIRTIRSAIRNLLVIIDDILDFSKIEAGKITFEQTGFELAAMVAEVAELQRSKANQKSLALECKLSPELPQYVVGDPVRLGQILHNLVSNALKFTEHGGVTIHAAVAEATEEQATVHFSVQDTGIGISEEKQALIFESFTQERADTTRKYGGTGLGLAIALQLVELQGGKMQLDSTPGKGSTFHFTLTFGTNLEGVELWEQQPDTSGAEHLKGLRVLLVDDNHLNHEVAESLLRDWMPDIHITAAWNGREALESLRKERFDLVLMDIQMPELDGYETSRLIRAELPEPAKSTPIVAMTANAMQGEAERCREAGMNNYIPKPIDGRKLIAIIGEVVGKVAANEQSPAPFGPELKGTVVDLESMYASARGNHNRVKRYISIVLKNTPGDLQELFEAFSNQEWELLAAKAHDMKGNMGYIGAASVAEELEQLRSVVLNGRDEDQLANMIGSIQERCATAISELKSIANKLD